MKTWTQTNFKLYQNIPRAARFAGYILSGLALLGLALIIAAHLVAPRYIARKLKTSFEKDCPTCHLSVGAVELWWLQPNRLQLNDLHLQWGEASSQKVEANVESTEAELIPHRLLSGQPWIQVKNLHMVSPVVSLAEGDRPVAKIKSEEDTGDSRNGRNDDEQKTQFLIESLSLEKGRFTYIRSSHGQTASLKIHKIEGTMGAIGNTPELINRQTALEAKGQIEHSGLVHLKVAAGFFAKPVQVEVDAEVTNDNVADLNAFFVKSDGVKLGGQLVRGRSLMKIMGKKLHASVRVEYKDLSVELKKSDDRGEIMSFLETLGAQIVLEKKNLKKDAKNQTRSVTLFRKERESIVHFLLRGMKEAAIHVAKDSGEQPEASFATPKGSSNAPATARSL